MRGRGEAHSRSVFTHTMTPRSQPETTDFDAPEAEASDEEIMAMAQTRLSKSLATMRNNIAKDQEICVLFDRSGSVTSSRALNWRQVEIADLLKNEEQVSLLAFTTEPSKLSADAAQLFEFKTADERASDEDIRSLSSFGGGGTPTAVALDYLLQKGNVAALVVVTDGMPADEDQVVDCLRELKTKNTAITAILQGGFDSEDIEVFEEAEVSTTADEKGSDFSVEVLAESMELLELNVLSSQDAALLQEAETAFPAHAGNSN